MTPADRLRKAITDHRELLDLQLRVVVLVETSRREIVAAKDEVYQAEAAERRQQVASR